MCDQCAHGTQADPAKEGLLLTTLWNERGGTQEFNTIHPLDNRENKISIHRKP